ncbi:MAG: type II CAAX endopeptidase family protein [Pyrinomonadaceae bacterium]
MELKSIFVGRSNILRSGWRFAVFFIAFVVLAVAFGGVAQTLLIAANIPSGQGSMSSLVVNAVFSLIPALFIGWLCGKLLEGLPFRALGAWFTRFWAMHLILGLVMGTATIGLAVLIAAAFGGLRFTLNPDQGNTAIWLTLAVSFAVFAIAAAFEEALFRGYILQTFNRSGLGWLAITLTSVFFGFVHIRNLSAGTISTLNTILAGVWFGIAYLKTRDLWFVWGMHLMWNWVQGAVFGIEVSGLTDITTAPLLKEIDKGPTWLTGETYGIEGGIACTFAIIASIAIIYFLPILKPSEEMLALTSSERSESKQGRYI